MVPLRSGIIRSSTGRLKVQLTLHDGHAHEMARAPVALDEPPGVGHVDRVPRVPEPVAFELDARLVAGRLAVALDNDTMKAGVAGAARFSMSKFIMITVSFQGFHSRGSLGAG